MRYAIIFETSADAEKLAAAFKVMGVRHKSIEVLDSNVMDMYSSIYDQMRGLLMDAYATPVEKLQKELGRAQKAFNADPTPSGASIIKQLQGKLRYARRKEAKTS